MVKNTHHIFTLISFVLFLVCFFWATNAEAATLYRPPNNLNLKAYWSFNEGTSTIATDFSRNYATGTLTNMEAADWVSGRLDNALSFDGVNEYVSLTSGLPSISGNAVFTMCAWINTTSVSTAQAIFATGNSGSALAAASIFLNAGANGALSMEFAGGNSVSTAGGVILADRWYHVCGVKTAGAIDTTSTLYVNGQSVALAGGASASTPNITTTGAAIGKFSSGASYYFTGKIDEVRVYNAALTAAEVSTLYRSGVATFSSAQRNPVTNGLIGHWSFDGRDIVNGGFLDRGSAGTHPAYMSATMATSTAYVPGRIGQAMRFDGADDYVQVPNSADFDFGSNNFTIAWWEYRTGNDNGSVSINRMTAAGDYTPFMLGYSNAGADLLIYMSSALGGWDVASGEVLGPVTLNQWAHYVVKRSGTTFTTYKDGVQTNTWESALALANAGGTDPQYDLTFGSYQNVYFLNGTLDDIRIYNRAITNTEVTQLYTVGAAAVSKMNISRNSLSSSGLVGLWSFDGPDMEVGATAYDRGSGGYDGTLYGMSAASAVPGRVGQALAFDGTDDYIQTLYKPTGYSAITIAAWVNLSSAASYPMVVSHGANGDSALEIRGYASTGRIECVNRSNNSGVRDAASVVGDGWHHYVCVGIGTNFTLYRDGVSLGSAGISHGLTSTVNLRIGRRSDDVGGSFYFPGKIDQVRVYNRALSATEVLTLYNTER